MTKKNRTNKSFSVVCKRCNKICEGDMFYIMVSKKSLFECICKECKEKYYKTHKVMKRGYKVLFKIKLPKVKTRKFWVINPVTRVVPNKKVYDRKKSKQELRKILKEL